MSQINIYFAANIKDGSQDVDVYYQIVMQLKGYGNVFTDHKESDQGNRPTDKDIHDQDIAMLKKSDCVVAEVTQPSMSVGYELGRAVSWNIPILCMFRPNEGKALSAMIRGLHDGSTVTVADYANVPQIPGVLADFFTKIKK